jgi:hypothetical protein
MGDSYIFNNPQGASINVDNDLIVSTALSNVKYTSTVGHYNSIFKIVDTDKKLFFSVNDIYAAICDCQVLHPDEQEQLEEEMAGKMFGTQHEANWKSKILQFNKKYLFSKTNDVIVGHTVFKIFTSNCNLRLDVRPVVQRWIITNLGLKFNLLF